LENRSPELTFADYVQTDFQFPLCGNVNVCDANGDGIANDRIARRSLPYDYGRRSTGALVGWSPFLWFQAALSYELEGLERDFSAVTDSDEDIWKLMLDFDVTRWLSARATVRYQDRQAGQYDAHYFEHSFPIGEAAAAAFNEGSRRYYWTDRERQSYSLMLDVTPTEKLSLYAEAVYTDDAYTDPNTGLPIGQSFPSARIAISTVCPRPTTSSSRPHGGPQHVLQPGIRLHAQPARQHLWRLHLGYLGVRHGDALSHGDGRRGDRRPLDNWGSDVDDGYDTPPSASTCSSGRSARCGSPWMPSGRGGRGHRNALRPGRESLRGHNLDPVPSSRHRALHRAGVLEPRIRPNLGYALRYWFESWKEENFASDFNQPTWGTRTTTRIGAGDLLGLDFKNYTNHFLSFVLNYRF
jgi:hypothetical protein